MSLDATRWAWKQQGLRPLHKLILLSLADRAGPDDRVWPSYTQLQSDTGSDRKTIWRAIKAMRNLGLIVDTGERKGLTGQIPVFLLVGVSHRENEVSNENGTGNSSKNGTIPEPEQFRFSSGNSSKNGTGNSSKNGIRNQPLEPTNEPEKKLTAVAVAKPSRTVVPIKQVVELYHEILPELPTVQKMTKTREGYIRQRWRDGDLPTLEAWRNYFSYVRESPFLMGRVNGSGDKPPFRADLEWLVRPANFAKVAEDKYHR